MKLTCRETNQPASCSNDIQIEDLYVVTAAGRLICFFDILCLVISQLKIETLHCGHDCDNVKNVLLSHQTGKNLVALCLRTLPCRNRKGTNTRPEGWDARAIQYVRLPGNQLLASVSFVLSFITMVGLSQWLPVLLPPLWCTRPGLVVE